MSEKVKTTPSISIRYAIPVLLALLIILAVGLTGWMSFRAGLRSVEALATRLTNEVTVRIEDHIAAFVDIPNLFHEMNIAAIKAGKLTLKDYDKMRALYWNEAYISQSVPYLYYGNEDGDFLGVDTQFGGAGGEPVYKIRDLSTAPARVTYSLTAEGIPLEELKRSDYDPRTRPWYQAAVEAGKATWSPIYVSSAFPVLVISPVYPIFDASGGLEGVLGIDLTLGELSDFIRGLEISPHGEAFLIERTGDMVAASTDDPPFKTEEDKQVRVKALDSAEPLVRETAQHLLERFGDFTNIDQRQQISFKRGNETYYAQIAPIRDERGLDWLSVVVIPASDFMGPVFDNLRVTAALGFIVLVVASVLGYLLASWIIKPVFTVTGVAAAIEAENWNLDPLKSVAGRSDEIGMLARVFQRMAEEVRAREQMLREQIKELTIQIDHSRKETQVKEIVDSDFFVNLQSKADEFRAKRQKKITQRLK